MKKYRWVLTAVFAAFLVGTSGCGKKTETIPITTISQSTDDDDPEDNLAASGDSDEIPEYDVDLSKNLNSFQLAIWGDTYEIPESYADFTALTAATTQRKSSRNPSQRAKSLKRTETRLPSILPIRTPRQSQWRNA